jgi:mbt repeat
MAFVSVKHYLYEIFTFTLGYCTLAVPITALTDTTATVATPFSWPNYLTQTQSRAVPAHAFKVVREISLFKKGIKLEVVDKRNPLLVRVATVMDVIGRQLKVCSNFFAT